MKQIWTGLAEINIPAGNAELNGKLSTQSKVGFTNIVAWADSAEDFEHQVKEMLNYSCLQLIGLEHTQEVISDGDYGDEMNDMIDRIKSNRSWVLQGTFHSYPQQ